MSKTHVLVVLRTSTFYGEDMREIDIIEKAVRKAVDFDNLQITFMITDDLDVEGIADKTDYIAFVHYPCKALEKACELGMKVLNFNYSGFAFDKVNC